MTVSSDPWGGGGERDTKKTLKKSQPKKRVINGMSGVKCFIFDHWMLIHIFYHFKLRFQRDN